MEEVRQPSDEELVRAWQNDRSEDAFNELCKRHLRYVMAVIDFGIDHEDRRELGYWCLFKAVMSGSFKPDTGTFKSYLAQVARNERWSYLRRQGSVRAHEVDLLVLAENEAAPPARATQLTPEEISIIVREAELKLRRFNHRWAEIIRMRYARRMSAAETARVLGITEAAVHTMAHRGILWLRKMINSGGQRPAA